MEITNKEYLKKLLEEQYDENDVTRIFDGYCKKRYVTLRVNTIKTTMENVQKVLSENNVEFSEVEWNDFCLIIKNKTEKDITNLQIYKNGEIYLQSLSSMLPPIIMNPQENEDILDMTAAPGGKTTEIAMLTNNQAHITACEFNAIRAERLRFNVEKQGASSVYVMQKDARNLDDYFSFDRILLDAPCSGSGTLDLTSDECFKYFSPKLVEKTTKVQFNLLIKALKLLKPGKEMIYSTCSILECENEEIINKALKKFNAEIVPIDFDKTVLPVLPVKIPGTLCICPNELFEGFFIARIRKK